MRRATEFIQGIAELQRGAKKIRSVLGPGKRQLEKAPDAKVSGETTDGGMTVTAHKVRSIDERAGFIVHMIKKGRGHPKVRAFATKAVSQKCEGGWCVDEGDYENEVRALFDAIRENVRYVRDTHGTDLFQHPARTLEFGAGDCDCYTILVCAALGSLGYPTRIRVIRTAGAKDYNHIYALVGLPPRGPTKWVPLDASIAKPAGWEPPAKMIADKRDFRVD